MVTKINPKTITVDFGLIKNDKMRNFKDRIWFIKYWAEFMKVNSDECWSEGQAQLIDGQNEHADWFYNNLEKTEEGRKMFARLKEERLKLRS